MSQYIHANFSILVSLEIILLGFQLVLYSRLNHFRFWSHVSLCTIIGVSQDRIISSGTMVRSSLADYSDNSNLFDALIITGKGRPT